MSTFMAALGAAEIHITNLGEEELKKYTPPQFCAECDYEHCADCAGYRPIEKVAQTRPG